MLIGAMNHPAQDVIAEMRWMAEMGLQFIDLTLEPPLSASWRVDPKKIRKALEDFRFSVVGHTAYYLPLASPFENIRKAAVEALSHCLDVFSELGCKWMNIHPDRNTPMHDRAFYIARNLITLQELIEHGRKRGVGIMIENLPGDFNNAAQLGELLDPLPDLGLHLDIGHANLLVPYNTAEEILARYGDRLRHVHLHDNKGGHADLHLPLGAGTVDLKRSLSALRRSGFDGTITLEVFTPDRRLLAFSRDELRKCWDDLAAPREAATELASSIA